MENLDKLIALCEQSSDIELKIKLKELIDAQIEKTKSETRYLEEQITNSECSRIYSAWD